MRADRWRDMGATECEFRAIRFGILDLPSIPFTSGVVLPAIPLAEKALEVTDAIMAAVLVHLKRNRTQDPLVL